MRFELLSKRQRWERFDTLFFLILYPLTIVPSFILLKQNWVPEIVGEPSNGTFAFIVDHLDVPQLEPHTFKVVLPFIVASFHILILLISHWSITFKKVFAYKKSDPQHATHVLFYPKHRGSPDIVELIRNTDTPYAIFQQKKLEFVNNDFKPLTYPVNEIIQTYLTSKGLTTSESKKRLEYYGPNSYQIPMPSFKELLKEHILAPFFVFQIFSNICWMFDEYFTFPLVSLLSLILVEANTVRTRQSNLLELRGVETKPIKVTVYRDGEWKIISSFKLVPGDIVFLKTPGIQCPADMAVLSGRCVVNEAMLTGESTPQAKISISNLPNNRPLNLNTDKRHIVFAGTRIEQILPGDNVIYKADQGCIAYVLSTGLGSAQGKLIRTILFASQRIAVESKGSIQLLMFLTVFAVMASIYVIYYGIKSTTISTFRIIVEVLLIITSTIPPDLPMELTLSVNSSLLALSKLSVFCTEPFRIPYAGSISVCCFDKTGTLTLEEYKFMGVDDMTKSDAADSSQKEIKGNLKNRLNDLSQESLYVIGSCHSLVVGQEGQLIGDSLESAAFKSLSFKMNSDGKIRFRNSIIVNKKTFHFSSELRRMSTITNITTNNSTKTYVLTKGAPEAIAQLLTEVPNKYYETYRNYTKQGCRVLALAYKRINGNFDSEVTREEVEKDLTFAGFSVFSSPLKRGTEDTIVELLRSTHRVVIITGDDPLTACNVASRIHIITKPPLIYDEIIHDEFGNEVKPDENLDNYSICYTEKGLNKIKSEEELKKVIRECNIFARMSPQSKANILIKMKEMGIKTLMCGDGTNDVGALKQADVGIGLVENYIDDPDLLNETEYKPKLGAASIAAPFVSKRATISACIDIIRFGRATLSSTIDLFKQLSLNCMISAYTVSVLFIENVKFGDRQMTIFSLALSFATIAVTFAKPLRTLSSERPFESQFNLYLVTSVLLQFAIHLICIIFIKRMVFDTGYTNEAFDYKVKFHPSLMNTAIFIATCEMQISAFITNYRGKPFMEAFFENRILSFSIIFSIIFVVVMLLNNNELVQQFLELVPFPTSEFRNKMVIVTLFDFVLSFVAEKICLTVFTFGNKHKCKGLVAADVLNGIAHYKRNNDDVLPEERHEFGLREMFKQNVKLQADMIMKHRQEEMKKRAEANKRKMRNKK